MNKPQIALIDADIFRYEVGSIETDHPFLPGMKIPGDDQLVESILDERIEGILTAVKCEDYIMFLTGKGNFREKIAVTETYKGHRSGKEKPYHWNTVDKRLRSHWGAREVSGIEADDMLAITQQSYAQAGVPTVICSRDKDLRMIEGWHYSWPCGEYQPERPLYVISKEEGIRVFWTQMLTGDWSTDAIPGCAIIEDAVWKSGERAGKPYRKRNGVGPKKAEEILAPCTSEAELYQAVRQQYVNLFADKAEEKMLEMGRLLFIGQTESALWTLPKETISSDKVTSSSELQS